MNKLLLICYLRHLIITANVMKKINSLAHSLWGYGH